MSYLKGADGYPLALDYALPVFDWAVLYRDSVFKSILPAALLRKDCCKFHFINRTDGYAVVNEDFAPGYTYQNLLLRKGDIIRFERPDMQDVKNVAEWLSDHKNNEDATLTFYHLNHDDLQYSAQLEEMYRSF
jgi:hypothetical protein